MIEERRKIFVDLATCKNGLTLEKPQPRRILSRFLSETAFATLLLASGAALYCGAPAAAYADDLYWNAGGTSGDG
ncbi:hypothetical protein V6767_12450, partial [Martelella sp. FLE1502]